MTIIQDLYAIFDNLYAKNLQKQVLKDSIEMEMAQNLDFLRTALQEKIEAKKIISGLENKYFLESLKSGINFDSLQKSKLNSQTTGNIKEFKPYLNWSTEKLVKKVYERIAVLKKISTTEPTIDISRRLQNLFKLMLLTIAHINGDKITLKKRLLPFANNRS